MNAQSVPEPDPQDRALDDVAETERPWSSADPGRAADGHIQPQREAVRPPSRRRTPERTTSSFHRRQPTPTAPAAEKH